MKIKPANLILVKGVGYHLNLRVMQFENQIYIYKTVDCFIQVFVWKKVIWTSKNILVAKWMLKVKVNEKKMEKNIFKKWKNWQI